MQTDIFEFIEIQPNEVYLGKDNGGLFFAAERPKHNVKITYQFAISKECISDKEWNELFKNNEKIPDFTQFNQENINQFLKILNGRNKDYKFRLPSEAEWEIAKKQLGKNSDFPHKNGELLADQPHVSYWGAPCNGSPWLEENPKGAGYEMQLSKHPKFGLKNSKENSKRGISRHKYHTKNIKFRIVKLPKTHIDSSEKKLPLEYDRVEIIKREIIIAIIIGIIPSFIWAFFNAAPGYIARGFGNLILGGVFFSLITGLIYRPRHSTLEYLENKIISKSPYRKKIKTLISFEDELP